VFLKIFTTLVLSRPFGKALIYFYHMLSAGDIKRREKEKNKISGNCRQRN